MTTQEMIFDYLKVQGLVPEYDEDKDIRFKYQMRNFVVSNYPDDRQFLQIMMPFIFDVTAENRVAALEACNKRLPQMSTSIRHTPMRLTPLASCASASMLLLKA